MVNTKTVLRFGRSGSSTVSLALLLVSAVMSCGGSRRSLAGECRVWEKVEITLRTEKTYENPYKDVELWVDLKGPNFSRRCHGFWDGGANFRVRVLPTAPGTWTWVSGSIPPDPGLSGVKGSFAAAEWTDAEKEENPCRRGMIRPSANKHCFEYADGAPFFLLGDTWWSASTFRYRWRDGEEEHPMGPSAGFKDFVRFRRQQGFNCIAIIAAFPNWANDDKPALLKTADGTVLRDAWKQAGTQSAKDMTDEDGHRAFLFPGQVPGHEADFPDVDRINPSYFQSLDRKLDHLNAQGFVPFLEVARRDVGQAWRRYYKFPESYTRYVQYVWSRYQADICLFSPIHLDWEGNSMAVDDWNTAANLVIEKYGPPPFGTLAGCNSPGSSLRVFDPAGKSKWITFHQTGNRRTHDCYVLLTEIFKASPPLPAINGEPYYDGMEGADEGTELAALYCRSAMYGSVLSGGLGGHIYGAGGWGGGLWGGNVEDAANNHIWDAMKWPSADQMRHLRTFVLSEGRKYQDLAPSVELVSPSRSGEARSLLGWAYCAHTADGRLFLLYFEKGCPRATLSGAVQGGMYQATWFNPRTGEWVESKPGQYSADGVGKIVLPGFPDCPATSEVDWGLKLLATTAGS
jgi:hypothetical protein